MKLQVRVATIITTVFVFVLMLITGGSFAQNDIAFFSDHAGSVNANDERKTAFSDNFSIIMGDTNGLSYYRVFIPGHHIERVGIGDPIHYYLDVTGDGIDDVIFQCGNSYGAMGYANNYLKIAAIDSNAICYSRVDSSYCFNGYKPIYFTSLFLVNDTVTNWLQFTQNDNIIDLQSWVTGDTCSIMVENVGIKYVAIQIKAGDREGLAWIKLELFSIGYNGFSADVVETGFKTQINSLTENAYREVSVFPNPTDGIITIDIPDFKGKCDADVVDMFGKTVLSTTLTSKVSHIELGKGFFLLKLTWDNQSSIYKKIVVR